MNSKIETDLNREELLIKKYLDDWFKFCTEPRPEATCTIPKPEDVPEDIRKTVIKIRQAFEERGIDPDTIVLYPVEPENTTQEPLNLTMKFNYDYQEVDK